MDFHQNKVMWQKPMQRDHNHSHHVELEKRKKGWQLSVSLCDCI